MLSKKISTVLFVLMFAGTMNVVAAPTIVTNFPIPSSSGGVVGVNPILNKIYVSGGAAGGQTVTVIDATTFAQTPVGTGSGVLSVDMGNDQYWAGSVYGGSVIIRDGVTNATVTNISLGYCPFETDVDSAHRRVWVGAQCGGDMVWAINADTFATIAGPINIGGVLGRIVVNPATGRLYAHTSGGPKRVDPTTFAVTLTAFGQVIGVNPVTNRVYAIPAGSSTLQIIDGAPDPEVILTSVSLPSTVHGYRIGVNTILNRIYVGAPGNTLYVLDGTSGSELGSLALGTGVSIGDGTVDSTNGRIYLIASTPVGPQLFILKDVPVVVDTTPPEITITVPGDGSEYLLNEEVLAVWTAEDDVSGIDCASGTAPSGLPIDTSTVGEKTFTVTATDNAGNEATVTVTYYVDYAFGGILPPINADGSSIFKLGSTIPVKFQLTDAQGNFVTDAVARLNVLKISNGIVGTEWEDAVSTSAATTGNLFRYDLTDNEYIFNLATRPLSAGTWQLKIDLDDGTSQDVRISLRK